MRKQQRGLVYLNAEWQCWLADNMASGSQPDDLQRLLTQAGFAPSVVRAALAQVTASHDEPLPFAAPVMRGSSQTGCGMHLAASGQCDACWLQNRASNATFIPQQSFALH